MPEEKSVFPGNLLEILGNLNTRNVPYIIVGGVAMALHGIPRATLDLDIIVPAGKETIHLLFTVVENAGLVCVQEDILSLRNRPDLLAGQWITFADGQGRELLDVFFEVSSSFEELANRAGIRETGGVKLKIAALSDIKDMKKSAGRPVDIADIALIEEREKIRDK